MNPQFNNSECSIIISSCSAYSDSWDPFFKLFFKYWPDCPYDVYLITDKLIYPDERVKTISLENDLGWPKNTRYALSKINTPYFIMLMEDFLLIEKVDDKRIKDLIEYTKSKKIDYLRLYPLPTPDKNFDKVMKVGEIDINAPYRLSLMTAIWRKSIFLDLLRDEESIWQMELVGSERSRDPKYKFFSVFKNRPAINHFPGTGIKKGKWRFDAVLFCKEHGIIIDGKTRQIESRQAYISRRLKNIPVLGRILGFLLR